MRTNAGARGLRSGESWLFASDLDGTLLDEESYGYEAARPALAALKRAGARLVLASSKTRAEMEPLARELGLDSPLIVENGGAVLLPRAGGGYDAIELGLGREDLVRALAEMASECGAAPRGFSALAPEDLMRLTNLNADAARLAMDRAYDEPFLLDDESAAPALAAAAERRELRITRGGRFFHLTGDADKGRALRRLLTDLDPAGGRYVTVGLGDAANDLPLLRSVDRPIVVPRRDGRIDPALGAALPGAERAPRPGPAGWNEAVLTVIAGGGLPTVAPRER